MWEKKKKERPNLTVTRENENSSTCSDWEQWFPIQRRPSAKWLWQTQSYVLIQIYKHTAKEGCQMKAAILVGLLNNQQPIAVQ